MSEEQQEQQQQQQAVDEKIVSLKIQLPEVDERLEIPCSVEDSLFDIVETLKVLPSTREYTSYQLKIDGKAYGEETIISELVKENADTIYISLVFSPYNEITARKHVIAAREYAGLESKDDAFAEISGVCSGASTYEDLGLEESTSAAPPTGEEVEGEKEKENEQEEKQSSEILKDFTVEQKSELSKLVSEICDLKPDLKVVAAKPNHKTSPALRSLFFSQWCPSDLRRKVAGDLFYLQAQTLEGEIFNITAHVSGFFVNNSSNTKFDGSVHSFNSTRVVKNYSLISLLKSLSPMFESQIEQNNIESSKHAIETYIVPNTTTVTSPWLVKSLDSSSPDLGRSQYNLLHGGIDGADLQVDWNKDYQLLRDIPKANLTQRYSREQSLISTSSSFTFAATKGAMAVVRGEIDPINPEEESEYHIFLRNGIFYSKAIDSIGQFKLTGGNEAARSTVAKDVAALKYLNRYDIGGVHSLLTTIVDYLGHRIVCQAPVPGIFQDNEDENAEPVQSVKYGFIDDHSDVVTDETFKEQFKEVGEAFHLKPHKIWNLDGSKVVDVVTSGYTKGTKGSDNKSYIIDLFRTTPLDIEFIDEHYDASKTDSYPHRETLLRHEAINEWIKRETLLAVKKETEKLEKEGKSNSEIKETIGVDNSIFLLNPDAFSLTAAPTPELAKELKSDEGKVREVSKFVNQVLIPEFIKEMEKAQVYNAIDGSHLSAILHEYGINIRYLGKIATLAAERKEAYLKEQKSKAAEIEKINAKALEKEEKEIAEKKAKLDARLKARKEAAEKGEPIPDFKGEEEKEAKEAEAAEKELSTELNTIPVPALLNSLYALSISEMIARATKHFLRRVLESVPLPLAPYVISHVHNCLLSSKANPNPEAPKLDTFLAEVYNDVDLSILEQSSKSITASISQEVHIRYRFDLPENWIDLIMVDQLMRSIAIKFGIQWKERAYAFTKEALDLQVENLRNAPNSIAATSSQTSKYDDKHSRKKGRKSSPKVEVPTEVSITSTTFVPEDIVCIAPVVKDSIFESTSVPDAWETGVLKLSSQDETQVQEGSIFINQAVQFCERLYGPVHNITATYLTKLGNLYASSSADYDAVILLKKSFQIFERCAGIDSYQAALALSQLANAYVSNKQITNAVKIYKRLIQYWILAFDEYHPNVITILTSVAVILMKLEMTSDAIKVFTKTLKLSDGINGELTQQSAFFRYQLSQLFLSDKRLQEALECAEKSFEGFKVTLGLEDKSTVDARKLAVGLKNYNEYMKYQAKNLQEKEQEARKLEQQQHIKAKQAQKAKQVNPDPEIANKSIDDIVAFISGSSSASKKKKNNKKKTSKK
ncbi:hypothetical protein PMKS-000026 [Pichia membranifaciens]|uniref:Clu domain-containing protein n=1 Tax=Pichia membranifaciens TaxID=4926 RepID=A0A1Q2YAM3_9ASCO|nr:hypothetical protein PMKS-000026 [Pichia membranifaciens]